MRHLTVGEVLELSRRVVQRSGGTVGVRDLGALESAVAQPRMGFGGHDLYPDLVAKAAALGFSLICNHPFVDGNKRIGHAAMELCLLLHGFGIAAMVDEQERVILQVASGQMSREEFTAWLRAHVVEEGADQ
jgi:death-on-curing protein